MIPYPPTTVEEPPVFDAPVFDDSAFAALEGIAASHAVKKPEVVVEAEKPDFNDIDIAALGESLGLDPSLN